MKFAKNIFGKLIVAIAATLMLLHSVVPHMHQSEVLGITSSDQPSSSNFLSVLFSTDLGEKHLEELQVPDTFSDWAYVLPSTSVCSQVLALEAVPAKWNWAPQIEQSPVNSSFELRGPPALI